MFNSYVKLPEGTSSLYFTHWYDCGSKVGYPGTELIDLLALNQKKLGWFISSRFWAMLHGLLENSQLSSIIFPVSHVWLPVG